MNGLPYEQMWLDLRHTIESNEQVGLNHAGEVAFGPCYGLMRTLEEGSLFPEKPEEAPKIEPPDEQVEEKVEAPKIVYPLLYPDFRVMWFKLAHIAESDPTLYQDLRKWMKEVEEKEMTHEGNAFTEYADKLLALIERTTAKRPDRGEKPTGRSRTGTPTERLTGITRKLVEMAQSLQTITESLEEA